MPLAAGAMLGPYEITAPIGAGGMGEVYRARDTRLDRTVAVKVLPENTADRPDVRQRFEREARAVSALNHPNICTLYDVGRHGGVDFLVMEYLEGETLADRLRKGPLPLDQALRTAIQVADALDRAHRTGITHRDLKPGNIMLTKDGAKVLDFGLAKMRERAPGALTSGSTSEGSAMATLTSPLTGEGAIVGTLQYMAPEQLEGQQADARSDIFAFGSIVYEMVAGRRPFEAKTQAALIANILAHEPAPISSVQPAAPPALEQLLRSCLAKDPAERRQNMHDVLLDLRWIAESGSRLTILAPIAPPIAPPRKARVRLWMAAAAVLAATTVALAMLYMLRPKPDASLMRFTVQPPEKSVYGVGLAISPDGRRLVFADMSGGRSTLWVRSLDTLSAQPIPGADNGVMPFWSPDNHQIGFFADGKLKRADIGGGPVQILADAPEARGGSWNQNGTILFAPSTNLPLQSISSGGGTPVTVTTVDLARQEISHRWPHFLPDGRHYLCYVYGSGPGNAIAVGSLDSKNLTILAAADSMPVYSPAGYVLFVRSNMLLAQVFNLSSLRLSGDPLPVAQDVAAEGEAGPTGYSRFTVSRNGILAYVTGTGSTGSLMWFDRAGKQLATIGDPGSFSELAFSPDQKQVVFDWNDSPTGNNLWMLDLTRNVKSHFSSGSAFQGSPVWSPDGSRVVFFSQSAGIFNLYTKSSTGAGADEPLLKTDLDSYPDDWSRDGRTLVFEVVRKKAHTLELWMLSLDDRKATPYLQTDFDTVHAALSPDGHWLAYASNESGRLEVYVQSFPSPSGGKSPISSGGGDQPEWRQDGKELYYATLEQKLMAVPVTTGVRFQAGEAHMLFQAHMDPGPLNRRGPRNYYLPTADGQKFLVYKITDAVSSSPMTMVLNWSTGIGK